jgi:hypothetical protein
MGPWSHRVIDSLNQWPMARWLFMRARRRTFAGRISPARVELRYLTHHFSETRGMSSEQDSCEGGLYASRATEIACMICGNLLRRE